MTIVSIYLHVLHFPLDTKHFTSYTHVSGDIDPATVNCYLKKQCLERDKEIIKIRGKYLKHP